jgi:hypothetical protein
MSKSPFVVRRVFCARLCTVCLVGGPQNEGTDNVGILDVSQLVALPRKAHDVVPQGLVRFLPTIVKGP